MLSYELRFTVHHSTAGLGALTTLLCMLRIRRPAWFRSRRIDSQGSCVAVPFVARERSSSCSCCLADAAARSEARLDDEQACPAAKAPSCPLQSCHSFRSVEEVRTAMLEKALPSEARHGVAWRGAAARGRR